MTSALFIRRRATIAAIRTAARPVAGSAASAGASPIRASAVLPACRRYTS